MICKVSELYTRHGKRIEKPRSHEGQFDLNKGQAILVTEKGHCILEPLARAQVESVSADGFRVTGLQGYPPGRIWYQEWFCRPVCAEKEGKP